jgi:hypothetical protein
LASGKMRFVTKTAGLMARQLSHNGRSSYNPSWSLGRKPERNRKKPGTDGTFTCFPDRGDYGNIEFRPDFPTIIRGTSRLSPVSLEET